MALICTDCGARIEVPAPHRRLYAGRFFACPNCGVQRKLPPIENVQSPKRHWWRIILIAVPSIIAIPLVAWWAYAAYLTEDARLYRAAVSELRKNVHDGNFEVTNWNGPHFLWYANDETKVVRACSISFRSHPNGPLLGSRVTTWYFGITTDIKLVHAFEDHRYRAIRFFDEDKIDAQSCITPIPAHIKEKHPIVVERERRSAEQQDQIDAIARMMGVGLIEQPAGKNAK